MKIRSSLRLFVLATVFLSALCMTVGYSVMSGYFFIEGLDTHLQGTAQEVVNTADVSDGQPAELLQYTVASRWQDLPAETRKIFPQPPAEFFKINKVIESDSFFSRPDLVHFIVKARNRDGDVRFVTRSFGKAGKPMFEQGEPPKVMRNIALIGGLALLLFMSLLLLIKRQIALPIERLRGWARRLTPESLSAPLPDFRYHELNALAQMLQNSLQQVQHGLAREQEFLSHASHELRTPIAVTRTNVELLKRLSEKQPLSAKQLEVLERVERASLTMTNLTETLLWLSREQDADISVETVAINEFIHNLIEEHEYLLQGKAVELDVQLDPCQIELPTIACRLVLANLIRNAFQHTFQGKVDITQQGRKVTICNQNDDAENDQQELGFGLGLQLAERLIQRFEWDYSNENLDSGRRVEVGF